MYYINTQKYNFTSPKLEFLLEKPVVRVGWDEEHKGGSIPLKPPGNVGNVSI